MHNIVYIAEIRLGAMSIDEIVQEELCDQSLLAQAGARVPLLHWSSGAFHPTPAPVQTCPSRTPSCGDLGPHPVLMAHCKKWLSLSSNKHKLSHRWVVKNDHSFILFQMFCLLSLFRLQGPGPLTRLKAPTRSIRSERTLIWHKSFTAKSFVFFVFVFF